ncbi:hypothetical protein H2198_010996 [Neophaeococcomyces mojaviensis]|uniref:Uncharacterized protein n=1 Tax=Neophaeococcomyces mojaviensis TaxID=3383035 RepID=A0ACC2ZM43_9EURO|nr:hypothetical protein H2198_010996 [Knufia sp. JES_112]
MDSVALPQILAHFTKREQCNEEGCEEMPTSTWEKTGIPVIISVVLFFLAFTVLFVIVRKRRLQNRKADEAAAGKIDLDDVEDRAAFRANRK